MCITFVYVNPNPQPGKWRIVLACNRDEFYDRETAAAEWKNGIICGRDLTPGKEGGTWLGMDKSGRIGLLTNIATGQVEKDGKGRGPLIIDYLENEIPAQDYLRNLSLEKVIYNPFNLILLEPDPEKGSAYRVWYYCRGKEGHSVQTEGPMQMEAGCLGISNHPMKFPFRKTVCGLEKFRHTICDTRPADLNDELLTLMKDSTKHSNDTNARNQIGSELYDSGVFAEKSSIFIASPGYGTRVQTLIFVDFDFNLVFEEHCRQQDGTWIRTEL